MDRTSLIYVILFGVAMLALWGIIKVGNTLSAPQDLSGKWTISTVVEGPASPDFGPTMLIEQSGRHLRLHFERSRSIDLKLIHESVTGEGDERELAIELAGSGWSARGAGRPQQDQMRFTLSSAGGEFILNAHRVERTYTQYAAMESPRLPASPSPRGRAPFDLATSAALVPEPACGPFAPKIIRLIVPASVVPAYAFR